MEKRAMSETTITLRGRVGSIPKAYDTRAGTVTVRFRFAVSTWRMTDGNQFVQGEAHWYTVRCWDQLARNVLISVQKGDPLIVTGRAGVNAWIDSGGEARGELVVTAQGIGFDLAYGRGTLIRPERRSAPEPGGETGRTEGQDAAAAPGDAEASAPGSVHDRWDTRARSGDEDPAVAAEEQEAEELGSLDADERALADAGVPDAGQAL
jgi:single-strand DNA-binding protein